MNDFGKSQSSLAPWLIVTDDKSVCVPIRLINDWGVVVTKRTSFFAHMSSFADKRTLCSPKRLFSSKSSKILCVKFSLEVFHRWVTQTLNLFKKWIILSKKNKRVQSYDWKLILIFAMSHRGLGQKPLSWITMHSHKKGTPELKGSRHGCIHGVALSLRHTQKKLPEPGAMGVSELSIQPLWTHVACLLFFFSQDFFFYFRKRYILYMVTCSCDEHC